MFVSTEPSALLLFASFALSTSLSYLAWLPPNPPPKAPYQGPRTPILDGPDPTRTLRRITLSVGLYYCALMLFKDWSVESPASLQPSSPLYFLCPNQHLVSPSIFTWSTLTIASQSALILGSSLRIFCFRTLGPDFSFQLTLPGKLKTSGLYAWVQHPSYVGAGLMLLVGNVGYVFRADGVQGCWIPPSLQGLAFWANCVVGGVYIAATIWGLTKRIWIEEDMLRNTFGQDWVVWHSKTARLIPSIF